MTERRFALQDIRWQQGLGEVAGVYLITDERSGKHYVGSASGGEGILQRWLQYASSGHGGNKRLIELLQETSERANDLRFTVLEPMPLLTPRTQVIAGEVFWKVAPGSRTFGPNGN